MDAKPPWEISAALQPERLELLDQIVRKTRADVVAATDKPERGDDSWVVGCRAHRWLQKTLKDMHDSGEYPWLTVETEGLYTSVKFEREPIRIYRGDPNGRPEERHLRAALRELERSASSSASQTDLFARIDDDRENVGWFWMFACDTDDMGAVLRTGVLQAHEHHKPRNVYILDEKIRTLATMRRRREAIQLPPVDVDIHLPNVASSEDDDGDDR